MSEKERQAAWDLRLISDKYGVPFWMVQDFYSKTGSIPETQIHYHKLSVGERWRLQDKDSRKNAIEKNLFSSDKSPK